MNQDFQNLEQRRVALQAKLDQGKTQAERNKLGQFATPTLLAQDILRQATEFLPNGESVRFLDPAIGTGAFYSALRHIYPNGKVSTATGYEIDPYYGQPAKKLWDDTGLTINTADFTTQNPDTQFNLVICNPPYVRHHHLTSEEKIRLQLRTVESSGIQVSGLAGLYCHFLGLTHQWMSANGIACWLIPSEFMDVNYGVELKKYLLSKVTLLQIHRFDPNDAQFADALVSSAVVLLRNATPPKSHTVKFSFGGSLKKPNAIRSVPAIALEQENKWTRFPLSEVRVQGNGPVLSDFFQIKRGIATGNNSFFIKDEQEIQAAKLPLKAFRPILPSPRYISSDEVKADAKGNPILVRKLFVLDPRLPEAEIAKMPTLLQYLNEGKKQGVDKTYICGHRKTWYAQENRPPAPIVCTYLGRSDNKERRPFRFILNNSKATVANVYLAMYPIGNFAAALAANKGLVRKVWKALNQIAPEQLLGEGRVYGGGLHKMEPKELANVSAVAIADLLPRKYRSG